MLIQEEGKISAFQLFLLIVGFTLGSSTLLPPGGGIGPDNWLAPILGLGEGLLFALIYLALASRFPGKTLVEIDDLVWGPYLGKLFSIAFLFYLFHLGSLVITNALDFIKFTLLPQTPPAVFILFEVGVCALAASAGVEVLGRIVTVLVIAATAMYFLVNILLLPQIKWINFQPLLATPWLKILAAGHRAAVFPFGEAVAFLMIIPFSNVPRRARSSVVAGLCFTTLLFIGAIIRNTGVLGATADYFLYPGYSASRLINVGEIFSRLEIFMGINYITTIFIKTSILIYILMLGTAQLCKLHSYRTLTIPVWLLISLLGMNNFANVIQNLEFANKVYPFYALPFQVGIPLLTLVTALIRKLPREGY